MDSKPTDVLKREIGVIDVAINAINQIVGGGIFILPALIAAILGNASILAYLVCGIMLFAVMLCFAETSSRITATGGAYIYVENAFGAFAGFITNSFFWFGFGILSDAAIANGMVDMMVIPFPWLASSVNRGFFFLILFGGFAVVNILGVKQGMKLVRFNTKIKLIPLLLLIIIGIFKIKTNNLYCNDLPSIDKVGEASLILFFAFQGGEAALNVGGEMKNPKRTAPLGILLGIGFVVVFYILIQIVSQGILGTDLQNHKEAPLAAVAKALIGPIGVTLLMGGAIMSIFGALSSSPLLFPRIIYAAAKDKLLPNFLSKIHPKFATPYWAIITYAVFSFIFSISGGFTQLAILSSASMLLIYLGVVLATIKLKLQNKSETTGLFKMPGGFIIPFFAVVVIIWFLIHLSMKEVVGIGVFVMVLTAIYLISEIFKKRDAVIENEKLI
jgi:APA family basic amino acid/polyamine antiporter